MAYSSLAHWPIDVRPLAGGPVERAWLPLNGPHGLIYTSRWEQLWIPQAEWAQLITECHKMKDRNSHFQAQQFLSANPGAYIAQMSAPQARYATSLAMNSFPLPHLVRFADGQVGVMYGPQGDIGSLSAASLQKGANLPVIRHSNPGWPML